MTVRPTLRCLRDDLGIALPPIDDPLDELDHPLIRKADDQFAAPSGLRERIRSVDDVVMFKVKVQRWRGAVVEAGEPSWLVVAGVREDGSRDDFYEVLATAAVAARTRYNADNSPPLKSQTFCKRWLPGGDDHDRYRAEAGVRVLRILRDAVHRLVCALLLDGHEHADEVAGAELGVLIQGSNERGAYIALRITGSVPDGVVAVVLTSWTPLRRRGSSKGAKPGKSYIGHALVQQEPGGQREGVFAEQLVGGRVTGRRSFFGIGSRLGPATHLPVAGVGCLP